MACDPSAELWPASFRGVPFWVLNDGESGGRRLVVHEFPGRDDPFVEDLGAKARTYKVTAYLASEGVAARAAALSAAVGRKGAGTLVLPSHGPKQVHAQEFERTRERDRQGYIAFSLSYVQEGYASALFSVASLANLIFVAADAVQAVVGQAFAATLAVAGVIEGMGALAPDYVRAAALDGYATALATLDVVRASEPVDTAVSLAQAVALQDLAASGEAAFAASAPDLGARLVEVARALGDGLDPDLAAPAFLGVVDAAPSATAPPGASVNRQRAVTAANAAARLLRVAALTAYAEALARRTYASRSDGMTARADLVEYVGAEIEACAGADDIALAEALEGLRNAVVAYLSNAITSLAPVVAVETPIRLPALVLAYRLYGDPARAAEIIDRNAVRVPSRVPLTFEALGF